MMRFIVPLVVFVILVGFFWKGLTLHPSDVPSPLINKPAPQFTLNRLQDTQHKFASQEMQGKVWMLNVWATWCESCREEHPVLVDFSRRNILPVVGLNYEEMRGDAGIDKLELDKLSPEDELKFARQRAQKWLSERGNPYTLTALDIDGNVGIDFGVYGVPESYIIDKTGIIRYKVTGPVTQEELQSKIIPLIRKLKG